MWNNRYLIIQTMTGKLAATCQSEKLMISFIVIVTLLITQKFHK